MAHRKKSKKREGRSPTPNEFSFNERPTGFFAQRVMEAQGSLSMSSQEKVSFMEGDDGSK